MRRATAWLAGTCIAFGFVAGAAAQGAASGASAAKKALVQKVLQSQQPDIENLAHDIVERPAAQMMQQAARVIQGAPADKREAMGKALDAEVHKYLDEAYPLVRERALRIAPATVGAVLEEKMTEDELKQIVAWLNSPVSKKYQELSADMREAFVQRLLADAQPVVDPKLRALDARIRVIIGVPPAAAGSSPAASSRPRPPAPPAKAASK